MDPNNSADEDKVQKLDGLGKLYLIVAGISAALCVFAKQDFFYLPAGIGLLLFAISDTRRMFILKNSFGVFEKRNISGKSLVPVEEAKLAIFGSILGNGFAAFIGVVFLMAFYNFVKK